MIGPYLRVNTRKGDGSGLTFTIRKLPWTSQAAKIRFAGREQGAQNKFKVREMDVWKQFSASHRNHLWNEDHFRTRKPTCAHCKAHCI